MFGPVLVMALGIARAQAPTPPDAAEPTTLTSVDRMSLWTLNALAQGRLRVAIEVPRGPHPQPAAPLVAIDLRRPVAMDGLPAELALANAAGDGLSWRSLTVGRRTVLLATRPDRPTLLDTVVTLPPAPELQVWGENLEAWRKAVEVATGEPLTLSGVPASPYLCRVQGTGIARELLAEILDCHDGNIVWSLAWWEGWSVGGKTVQEQGFTLELRAPRGLEDPLDGKSRPSIGERPWE